MDAVLLCAGLGTRLRPHTLTTPNARLRAALGQVGVVRLVGHVILEMSVPCPFAPPMPRGVHVACAWLQRSTRVERSAPPHGDGEAATSQLPLVATTTAPRKRVVLTGAPESWFG